jgi:hypothetical protein
MLEYSRRQLPAAKRFIHQLLLPLFNSMAELSSAFYQPPPIAPRQTLHPSTTLTPLQLHGQTLFCLLPPPPPPHLLLHPLRSSLTTMMSKISPESNDSSIEYIPPRASSKSGNGNLTRTGVIAGNAANSGDIQGGKKKWDDDLINTETYKIAVKFYSGRKSSSVAELRTTLASFICEPASNYFCSNASIQAKAFTSLKKDIPTYSSITRVAIKYGLPTTLQTNCHSFKPCMKWKWQIGRKLLWEVPPGRIS